MRPRPPQRIAWLAVLAACAAAAVFVGAGSGAAHPPALVDQSGDPIGGKLHRWLHQARVPLVGGRIQLRVGDCPGAPLFVGCIFVRRPRVIYLSPAARSPRVVLYHELGHAFDLRVLRPIHRRRFKRIVGIPTRGWFTSRPPASEWFADAYTFCAERNHLRRARPATPYGYRATPRRHARICALIERAAAEARRDRRKGDRPAPRPPADAPPIAEPRHPPPPPPPGEEQSPPPSGEEKRPSGPYQPPAPAPPTTVLPRCSAVEALITGCEPG